MNDWLIVVLLWTAIVLIFWLATIPAPEKKAAEEAEKHIFIVYGGRGKGKTTVAAEWCKANNGVMLCFSAKEARRVERKYGIVTMSNVHGLCGLRRPVAIDNLNLMQDFFGTLHSALNATTLSELLITIDDPFLVTATLGANYCRVSSVLEFLGYTQKKENEKWDRTVATLSQL